MKIVLFICLVLYATFVVYFGFKIVSLKDRPVDSLKYFVNILFSRGNWLTDIIASIVCIILFPLFILIPITDGIVWIWNWYVNRRYY